MRITFIHPAQVARAYAVNPTGSGGPNPAAQPRRQDVGDGQTDRTHAGGRMQRLIAGVVAEPVAFGMAAAPGNAGGVTLPLYARAADKVEAAVGVHLGRTVDLSA